MSMELTLQITSANSPFGVTRWASNRCAAGLNNTRVHLIAQCVYKNERAC